MQQLLGEQFGSYRLTALLGSGGFAEVYLGQHTRLNQKRASVKILRTRLSPESLAEFQQEADFITSLDHPHIIHIYDFDVRDEMPFLVMDYCPNGTMRALHPKGT